MFWATLLYTFPIPHAITRCVRKVNQVSGRTVVQHLTRTELYNIASALQFTVRKRTQPPTIPESCRLSCSLDPTLVQDGSYFLEWLDEHLLGNMTFNLFSEIVNILYIIKFPHCCPHQFSIIPPPVQCIPLSKLVDIRTSDYGRTWFFIPACVYTPWSSWQNHRWL